MDYLYFSLIQAKTLNFKIYNKLKEVYEMVDICICVGSACHLKGSYEVIDKLKNCVKNNKLEDKVNIKAAFCLGHCTEAVSVKIGDNIFSVEPATADHFFDENVLRSLAL